MAAKLLGLFFGVLSGSGFAARPYYATETNLAQRLETQAEGVASPTTSSLPPLPSRWGAAVLEAVAGGDATKAAIVASVIPAGTVATASLTAESVNQTLQAAMKPGNNAFEAMEQSASADIAEKSQVARDALGMLMIALEATGSGKALFTSIALKGAVSKWNALVSGAINEWAAVSQRYKAGGAEQKAIEAFLDSAQTQEVRNVLASFGTR